MTQDEIKFYTYAHFKKDDSTKIVIVNGKLLEKKERFAMNSEEIIEMAKQAGFKMENSAAIQAAEIFANLVAAKEREACAKVCESHGTWDNTETIAKAIRARGQQ